MQDRIKKAMESVSPGEVVDKGEYVCLVWGGILCQERQGG